MLVKKRSHERVGPLSETTFPVSVSICCASPAREREFFIDNLLVRIHFIIVMIRWTGLAPWEFEFPFAGSLTRGRSARTPFPSRSASAERPLQHQTRHLEAAGGGRESLMRGASKSA